MTSLYCTTYTSFEFQNGFLSGWRCCGIAASTALQSATWHHTAAHLRPDLLPLAIMPSRRLLHLLGTVSRSQYEHRHQQFSAVD